MPRFFFPPRVIFQPETKREKKVEIREGHEKKAPKQVLENKNESQTLPIIPFLEDDAEEDFLLDVSSGETIPVSRFQESVELEEIAEDVDKFVKGVKISEVRRRRILDFLKTNLFWE